MLSIVNDGQQVASTNYFDSEHARCGLCFLSWNAGCARVLLPDSMVPHLIEMRTADLVIVSRGPWTAKGGVDALELLFEDGSSHPYSIHMGISQTDRILPESDQGKDFIVAIWTRDGEQLRLPAKYRLAQALPWLQPWGVANPAPSPSLVINIVVVEEG